MGGILDWCGEGARAACARCCNLAIVLSVTWRARLSEHLGSFAVELLDARAARVLDDEAALAAIGSLTALAKLLAERDPHAQLYAEALHVLRALDDPSAWPALWCAGNSCCCRIWASASTCPNVPPTGVEANLSFVSPRSGRAVSRDAGQPYCNRLLKLPRFLLEEEASPPPQDVAAGFALTGHFLERDVLGPQGLAMPQPRDRLIELLARAPRSLEPIHPMR